MQPLESEIDEAPRKPYGNSEAVTVRRKFPRGGHFAIGQAGFGGIADYAPDRARTSAPTAA